MQFSGVVQSITAGLTLTLSNVSAQAQLLDRGQPAAPKDVFEALALPVVNPIECPPDKERLGADKLKGFSSQEAKTINVAIYLLEKAAPEAPWLKRAWELPWVALTPTTPTFEQLAKDPEFRNCPVTYVRRQERVFLTLNRNGLETKEYLVVPVPMIGKNPLALSVTLASQLAVPLSGRTPREKVEGSAKMYRAQYDYSRAIFKLLEKPGIDDEVTKAWKFELLDLGYRGLFIATHLDVTAEAYRCLEFVQVAERNEKLRDDKLFVARLNEVKGLLHSWIQKQPLELRDTELVDKISNKVDSLRTDFPQYHDLECLRDLQAATWPLNAAALDYTLLLNKFMKDREQK